MGSVHGPSVDCDHHRPGSCGDGAGGAYAVATFTNVALEDPSSGARASVDSTHHLRVGDGSGALTVDGSVYVRPLAPTRPWRFSLDTSANFTIWLGPSSLPLTVRL